MNSKATAVVLLALLLSTVLCEKAPGRGWPDEVDWMTYSDGLSVMKATGKPMMIIFHKEWW